MPRPDLFITGKRGTLPEATWNFMTVSDEEVVACCLWEYARESPTIALAAEVHRMTTRDIRSDSSPPPTDAQLSAWAIQDDNVRGRVNDLKFDYNKFLERFWACDLGYLGIYELIRTTCTGSARPFLSCPKKARRYIVNKLTETTIYQPVVESSVGDLELLWNNNSVDLVAVRSHVLPLHDDSETMALYEPTRSIFRTLGEEQQSERTCTVAFTVDFSRFSDAEIEAAFRRWLLKHRPRRWRKPTAILPTAARRGRKVNDYRVALERLGLMRLLNQLTPSELRANLPTAWKIYGHKSQDFRREIRAAVRFFCERFPFLPSGERPKSEQRFATWWRPLQKDLARME